MGSKSPWKITSSFSFLHLVLISVFLAIAFLAFSLGGCGGTGNKGNTSQTTPPPQAPAIQSFTVSPQTAAPGTQVSFSWQTSNATSVNIDNGIGNNLPASGSKTLAAPTATTTFTLTAVGAGNQTATSKTTLTIQTSGPQAPAIQSFTVSPQNVSAGTQVTFSWQTTNATSVNIDNGVGNNLPASGSKTFTAPATTTTFTLTAVGAVNQTATSRTTLNIQGSKPPTQGVVTRNFDNMRSGINSQETQLTPGNVTAGSFGQLFSYSVDGAVYGQPLYVSGLTIGGNQHNVIFVATESDTVYAFDADRNLGAPLWQTSLIDTANGETGVPCAEAGDCSVADPVFGVTATPVISLSRNAIYVEARSKQNGAYFHKLHALDLTTGAEKFGGPTLIQASVPGTASDADSQGMVNFNPLTQNARPALLLLNNVVYISFASVFDLDPYHGWFLGYNADTLQQVSVLNITPNGLEGGIWQNNGPAVDNNGNIFVVVGNGTPDPSTNSYGESFLKLQATGGQIKVADYFTPFNASTLDDTDLDVGSGGGLLLPDQTGTAHPHLIVAAGKEGKIYLVDRDNMGKFNATDDSQIVQSIPDALGSSDQKDRNFFAPVFWNGNVYFCGNFDVIKAFSLQNGLLSTSPVMQSSVGFGYPGSGLVISANGSSNAILWALDTNSNILYAFDPATLSELWDSNQTGNDNLTDPTRLNVPLVFNGKVYVSGSSDVVVFGLLQ